MEQLNTSYEFRPDGRFIIKDANIMYPNFSGAEKRNQDGRVVNSKGNRNFCIRIGNDNVIAELKKAGWKIKPERGEEDAINYIMPISINLNPKSGNAPVFKQILSDNSTVVVNPNDGSIDNWDCVAIAENRITVVPWKNMNGELVAYLKTLYVKVEADEFEDEFMSFVPAKTELVGYSTDENVPW